MHRNNITGFFEFNLALKHSLCGGPVDVHTMYVLSDMGSLFNITGLFQMSLGPTFALFTQTVDLGSMWDIPIEVAVALGLFVREISFPAYRNCCSSFSTQSTTS